MSICDNSSISNKTNALWAEIPQPARQVIGQIVQSTEALKALMTNGMTEQTLPIAEPIPVPAVARDLGTSQLSGKPGRKCPESSKTSEDADAHRKHFFLIDDAERYGRDEAILLTDIRHWLRHNRKQKTENTVHDGQQFFYSTIEGFQKRHPYYSPHQVRRILDSLVKQGILIKDHHHRNGYLRDNWYTLDEPEFRMEALSDKICRFGQMDLLESANVHIENNKEEVVTVNQLELDVCFTLDVDDEEAASCFPMDQDDVNEEVAAQLDTPELTEKNEAPVQPEVVAALKTTDGDGKPATRTHKTSRKAPAPKKSKKTQTRTPPRRKPTRKALKQQQRSRNTGVVQPMTTAPGPDWLEEDLEWNPQASGFDFERCLTRLWDQLEHTRLPLNRHDLLDQTHVRSNLIRYFKTAEKPGNDWALTYVCNGQKQRLGVSQRSNRISEARDRRNEALAQLLDKQAQSFKAKSQSMRTYQTTLEKLTDRSWWDEGLL